MEEYDEYSEGAAGDMKLAQAALLCTAAQQTAALAISGKPNLMVKPYKREALQDIVTWDEV
ncbi:hypothetical protein LTR53_018985 [Teratosphaeriaceae sp. CCFEE 6253]|nr:hypothetical protein LTR53_018985 [Teratosphaeriaceae sp. CCFEE 6253]